MAYQYKGTQLYDLKGKEKESYIDFTQINHKTYFYREIEQSRSYIAEDMALKPSKTEFIAVILVWDVTTIIAKGELKYMIREKETNSDLCEISIEVHPDYLRRGIGTELLQRLLKMAEEHKMKTFEVWCNTYALDGLVVQLVKKLGLKPALDERFNRLYREDVNQSLLNNRLPGLEEKFKRYKLLKLSRREYWQRILDDVDFRTDAADFETESMGLIPKEDSVREISIYTPDDMLQEAYVSLESPLDGVKFILMDGKKIAGFSETRYPKGDLSKISWGLTGVRKQYQRQGIGLYLKLKMITYYLQFDEFQYIDTVNNRSNTTIIKLNEEIGFKYLFSYVSFEGNVTEIRNKLLKK